MLKQITDINKLVKLASEIENYSSERVRNMCLKNLQYACNAFGYDFQHWQDTGRFVKYQQTETVCETLETDVALKSIETDKTLNTRLTRQFVAETVGEKVCEFCLKPFSSARKEKRFCKPKCKNDFNNAKRKEV